MPLLDVVEMLSLGEPVGRWGEPRIRCPFHDDSRPSLRLHPAKGLWRCDPCGLGGDGIRLVELVLRVSFAEAVREVTGTTVTMGGVL